MVADHVISKMLISNGHIAVMHINWHSIKQTPRIFLDIGLYA